MGKPAARIGDTTSHGGSIVAGAPTVLIGGMPAARMNDMHVCPLVNPGVPPPPHVGGPALIGSPTVLICGQMALRMGDMAQCSGPPDSIVAGCPTVLIGESAGAGAPGFGLAGAVSSAAIAGGESSSDTTSTTAEESQTEDEEDHFLQVKFVDKAGNPVTGVDYKMKAPDSEEIRSVLSGTIKKAGVKEGDYDIELIGFMGAWWSVAKAKVGDKVDLVAGSFGIESGTKATIKIFLKDVNSSDKLLKIIETEVENDRIEADWTFEINDDFLKMQNSQRENHGYSSPEFYFVVSADKSSARSDFLRFEDWLELKLKDEDGKAIGDVGYRVYLPNGEIREGKLDSSGYAKEEKIPPGKAEVRIDNEIEEG
jgi:uncharacterized Zn-binding protein involved in type VI secretion